MIAALAARLGLMKPAAVPATPKVVNPFGIFDATARSLAALDSTAEAEAGPERERIDAMTAKAKSLRDEADRLDGQAFLADNALSHKGAAVDRRRTELRNILRATAPDFVAATIDALRAELDNTTSAVRAGSAMDGFGDRRHFTNHDEVNEFGRRVAEAIRTVRGFAESGITADALEARIADVLADIEERRPTRLKVPRWAAGAVGEQIGAENVEAA